MDIESLLHALDNDNNEGIVDLNMAIIAKNKNDILQKLRLPRNELVALQRN